MLQLQFYHAFHQTAFCVLPQQPRQTTIAAAQLIPQHLLGFAGFSSEQAGKKNLHGTEIEKHK